MTIYAGTDADDHFVGTNRYDRMDGHGGDDRLDGQAGNDSLDGDEGDDVVLGGAGADGVSGGAGVNRLDGGTGDDYIYAHGADEILGGDGDDFAYIYSGLMGALLDGGEGHDQFSITGVLRAVPGMTRTVISGWEYFSSNGQGRVLTVDLSPVGSAGYELDLGALANIRYDNYRTQVTGSDGADTIIGSTGGDTYRGGRGVDVLSGGDGYDRLTGDAGADVLNGGSGDDVLTGGGGRDTLTGGRSDDTFVFATGDLSSRARTADRITDFSQVDRDRIDLTGFDVDPATDGIQRFRFTGAAAFTGVAGELRSEIAGRETLVTGDLDGDAAPDVFLRLDGRITLVAADFLGLAPSAARPAWQPESVDPYGLACLA